MANSTLYRYGGMRDNVFVIVVALTMSMAQGGGVIAHAEEPGAASAQSEVVVVYGRANAQIGLAGSASEGLVGYDDIRLQPMLRVGELVEAVPGMVATQHAGTGKACLLYTSPSPRDDR